MDPSLIAGRLDAITTRWSLIQRAHGLAATSAVDARRVLILRYAPAIKSYIRGITRDELQADELAQDAVVRLMQGDFAGADPRKGRFRDLLKTAVRNMVRNHWAKEKRRKTVDFDPALVVEADDDNADRWVEDWRDRVLELTWDALKRHEQAHPDSMAYAILRLRVAWPDDTSEDLAHRLSEQLRTEVRADAFRQKLRRARLRFAECLVDEIADGLDAPTPDRVEEELIAIGLWEHVKPMLPNAE